MKQEEWISIGDLFGQSCFNVYIKKAEEISVVKLQTCYLFGQGCFNVYIRKAEEISVVILQTCLPSALSFMD